MTFRSARVAVFIDGCFWHGCPEHLRSPRTNTEYWLPKLQRNRERDAETTSMLAGAGWLVLRFWEHEEPAEIAATIIDAVHSRRSER